MLCFCSPYHMDSYNDRPLPVNPLVDYHQNPWYYHQRNPKVVISEYWMEFLVHFQSNIYL